jgi:hypothetical protein
MEKSMEDDEISTDDFNDLADEDVRELLADEARSSVQDLALALGEATPASRATITRLIQENEALQAVNIELRRQIGRARLLADLQRDAADLRRASLSTPALLRPQI